MLILILPLKMEMEAALEMAEDLVVMVVVVDQMEMEVALEMAEDLMVMVVVVDQMVMEEVMVKDLLEMEVVMAVDLKDQLDQLASVEDQAMVDGARVDQEVQEVQEDRQVV